MVAVVGETVTNSEHHLHAHLQIRPVEKHRYMQQDTWKTPLRVMRRTMMLNTWRVDDRALSEVTLLLIEGCRSISPSNSRQNASIAGCINRCAEGYSGGIRRVFQGSSGPPKGIQPKGVVKNRWFFYVRAYASAPEFLLYKIEEGTWGAGGEREGRGEQVEGGSQPMLAKWF